MKVRKISIAKPYISNLEIKAVTNVLKSGMLARGKEVAQLEEGFRKLCGTKFSAAVSSGTAALHTAVFSIGIKPGDEVITTPFTFVSTIHAIMMSGGTPVFADIDPKTFNIDPKKIEKVITKKTKAIITVDLYGQPADYKEINRLAKKHKLLVIEDAAQAVGAQYDGKYTGNLGDIGCFSMYATKNITTGEGGMLTTNVKEYWDKSQLFRHHGQKPGIEYEYECLGYNLELSDVAAAIGNVQLSKLKEITKRRQAIAKQYNKGLAKIKGLVTPFVGENRTHVYHQYTLRLAKDFVCSRDELVSYLREKGIGCRVYYPVSLHKFQELNVKHATDTDMREVLKATQEVLSIPCHPNLKDSDISYIIDAVRSR
jgi:perosamine synthetase